MLNSQKNKLINLRTGNISYLFNNSKFKEHITQKSLGKLFLPTGKIVANDPLCLYENEPFEKCVPIGNYEVILYIHHINNDCRVAFSEIRFSENNPVSFEIALTKQQTMETLTQPLNDGEYFGYGVDSGTGSFMDKATCDMLNDLDGHTDNCFFTKLEDMMDKSYIDTYSTANCTLPNSNNNIVVFSTGYGDGSYPSFWGYDEKGILCSLITDFFTIDEQV